MPRKTTAQSLKSLKSGNTDLDKIAQDLLLKISEGLLIVTKQAEMSDDEHSIVDYYGEYKGIGVTCRSLKKIRGINPRYILIIETDDDEFSLPGPYGAKAWNLANLQTRTPRSTISQDAVGRLLDTLDLEETQESQETDEPKTKKVQNEESSIERINQTSNPLL